MTENFQRILDRLPHLTSIFTKMTSSCKGKRGNRPLASRIGRIRSVDRPALTNVVLPGYFRSWRNNNAHRYSRPSKDKVCGTRRCKLRACFAVINRITYKPRLTSFSILSGKSQLKARLSLQYQTYACASYPEGRV